MSNPALVILIALSANVAVAAEPAAQSPAIKKIQLLGGEVQTIEQPPGENGLRVSFSLNNRFNDKYVHLLTSMQDDLIELDLSGTGITDEGLSGIAALKNLKRLDLADTTVSAAGVAELRKSCPSLVLVEDVTPLQRIKELGGTVRIKRNGSRKRSIDVILADRHDFTDSDAQLLASLKDVAMLQLQNTRITDQGLKQLKRCRDLTALLLFENQITDEGLQELKDLKKLFSLWLGDTKITDDGLKSLVDLTKLSQLDLFASHITDAGLKTIGEFQGLTVLNLGRTHVTDTGLKELSRLTNLVRLDLVEAQVTDNGLIALRDCRKLKFLNLQGTRVTDAGMKLIPEFKQLQALFLGDTMVTDECLNELKKSLPKLQITR